MRRRASARSLAYPVEVNEDGRVGNLALAAGKAYLRAGAATGGARGARVAAAAARVYKVSRLDVGVSMLDVGCSMFDAANKKGRARKVGGVGMADVTHL